jgi:hypothetical protein
MAGPRVDLDTIPYNAPNARPWSHTSPGTRNPCMSDIGELIRYETAVVRHYVR